MGKKDKRRSKLKKFVQNKQKQERSKNGQSLIESHSTENIPQTQILIHNLNTMSFSPDDRTINENTPLNVVTDSYESITPLNNSTNNSPPPSSLPIHEPTFNPSSNSLNTDSGAGNSVYPQSGETNLAHGLHQIVPETQYVETVSTVNLNSNKNGTNHSSTRSLRSTSSITQTRKWLSIAIVSMIAIVIGCDFANIWLHQSQITSQYEQFFNTLQLLLWYMLGFLLQGHFQFNFSIQTSLGIVAVLQISSFTILSVTDSVQLLLISRLISGMATGLFFTETLIFSETIGSVKYNVPFQVTIGLLIISLFGMNDWQCSPLYLVGSSIFILFAIFTIVPSKKEHLELPSNVINKKNTFLLSIYIVCQFLLTFNNVSYASVILLSIVVPLYVYWDKTTKDSQLLLDYHQDKVNVVLRVTLLLFATLVLYSLPIYLDIFDGNVYIISWILGGCLVGMVLYQVPPMVALLVLIIDVISTAVLISVVSQDNPLSKILMTTGIICLTTLSLNFKPLQRESLGNFTFEVIVIVVGLVITDLIVHAYTKCLIHDKLIRLVSKKHPYEEIVNNIIHSDRSLQWIKTQSPKYAVKAIKACYKRSLHIIESVAAVLLLIACVLSTISK
ncbi:hypothetical protein MOSE0_G07404 [Monosporozyma servazzii]